VRPTSFASHELQIPRWGELKFMADVANGVLGKDFGVGWVPA
jgi:hypothetical protein